MKRRPPHSGGGGDKGPPALKGSAFWAQLAYCKAKYPKPGDRWPPCTLADYARTEEAKRGRAIA